MKIQKKKNFFFFFWGGGGGGWGGVRVDVNEELKFLWKFKNKNKKLGGGGGVWVMLGGRQVGCDRRIEVFGKIDQKKNLGGGGGGGRVGGGIRVDVNKELKFL